jgi:hypothetical protein
MTIAIAETHAPASLQIHLPQATKPYKGGPRTAEGKTRSRRNALKHGLRADTLIFELHTNRCKQHQTRLRFIMEPQGPLEHICVSRCALAATKLDVATQAQLDEARDRAEDNLNAYHRKAKKQVRRTAQNLSRNPNETVAKLESSGYGIDWLIRHWESLRAEIEAGSMWSSDRLDFAYRLLGLDPADVPLVLHHEPEAAVFWQAFHAAEDDQDARLRLLGLLDALIEELQAGREEAYQNCEAKREEQVVRRTLIDDSPAGQRLQRYEKDAEASFYRNLNATIKLQKIRQQSQANHPAPAPKAPPAPNELPKGPERAKAPEPKSVSKQDLERMASQASPLQQERTAAAPGRSVEPLQPSSKALQGPALSVWASMRASGQAQDRVAPAR